jgi:hypothetical protein
MSRFALKNTFIKIIHISIFDKYFYKNKKSKLCFGDRIIVQNDFIFKCGGSTMLLMPILSMCWWSSVTGWR